jgi:hypothetical protein
MQSKTRFAAVAAVLAATAALLSAPAQAATSFHLQLGPSAPYGYGYGYGHGPQYNNHWAHTGGHWGSQNPYRARGRDQDRDGIPDRWDRDRDNDGRLNWRDRDRDGDGVRNHRDRFPDNRRRY